MTERQTTRDSPARTTDLPDDDVVGLCWRLRAMADSLPVLIQNVDSDERVRFVSATWDKWWQEGIVESCRDDVIGKDLRSIYGNLYDRKLRPFVQQVLAGKSVSFEYELRAAKGQLRYRHVEYTPHVAPDGTTLGFHVFSEDITDRRQSEEVLRVTQYTIDRCSAPIAWIRSNGQVFYTNEA